MCFVACDSTETREEVMLVQDSKGSETGEYEELSLILPVCQAPPRALRDLTHFILPTTLRRRFCHCLHFTDEEEDAGRVEAHSADTAGKSGDLNQVLLRVRKCHREGVLKVVWRLPEGLWVGLAEGTACSRYRG